MNIDIYRRYQTSPTPSEKLPKGVETSSTSQDGRPDSQSGVDGPTGGHLHVRGNSSHGVPKVLRTGWQADV